MIIAVTNEKGGVGKTTTAVNIAAIISSRGHSVMLIDADPQASATFYAGCHKSGNPSLIDVLSGKCTAEEAVMPTEHGFKLLRNDGSDVNEVLYADDNGMQIAEDGTATPLIDAEGNEIKGQSDPFIPTETSGSVEVKFTIDTEYFLTKSITKIVAFEDLREYETGVTVAIHADVTDRNQMPKIPSIHTTLTDSETNDHLALADTVIELNDKVAFENLNVGDTYTVSGKLMDKTTSAAVAVNAYASTDVSAFAAEGAEIISSVSDGTTVSVTFKATAEEGYVTVPFGFNASDLKNHDVVAYENLYFNELLIATHEDIDDEGQTVHIPEIGTTAIDGQTGDNVVSYGETTIVDTVAYHNLIVGKEYTFTGKLFDKETGEEITAEYTVDPVTFTATEKDGSIEVPFHITGADLSGKTIVAFETVLFEGKEIAVHADIEDEDQTVYVPDGGTTLIDTTTDSKIAALGETIFVDTVAYTNLVVGKEYTVTGTMMVKSTGEALKNADGTDVTAAATFTPEEKDGQIELSFTIDTSELAGEDIVAFESVTHNGIEVFAHADIDDEGQTVHVPEIGTTAVDEQTQDNVLAVGDTVIVDTVAYHNLVVGKEYTVTGKLYDKETGEELADEYTAEPVTFTAEEADGSINVEFHINTTELGGKTLVAFETVDYSGIPDTIS